VCVVIGNIEISSIDKVVLILGAKIILKSVKFASVKAAGIATSFEYLVVPIQISIVPVAMVSNVKGGFVADGGI
jgi:hypothetical protein